jgi:acyl carrier protein
MGTVVVRARVEKCPSPETASRTGESGPKVFTLLSARYPPAIEAPSTGLDAAWSQRIKNRCLTLRRQPDSFTSNGAVSTAERLEMTEDQAVDFISDLVCRGRPIRPASVNPDTKLVDDLGFDSLDAAELLAAIHAQTGLQLDVNVAKGDETVGGVARIVARIMAAGEERSPA